MRETLTRREPRRKEAETRSRRDGVARPPRRRVAASRIPRVPAFLLALLFFAAGSAGLAQKTNRSGSHSSRVRPTLSLDERDLVERAITVVCTERKKDPKGSVPIDDMQARPSLPVSSLEAQAGVRRAQVLLPLAKNLVIDSVRQLAEDYSFQRTLNKQIQEATSRVRGVRRVKADMEARDNASVFLNQPHTIHFGTIFLAGLPSDEGMISVLAHELTHIADGDSESLRILFRAVGQRASDLTSLDISEQRAEELTCDLIGAMVARTLIASSPNYEPLPRRIARAIEHNCVDEDEGDEDHLSPRNTILALLALDPSLVRQLVAGREEYTPASPTRN